MELNAVQKIVPGNTISVLLKVSFEPLFWSRDFFNAYQIDVKRSQSEYSFHFVIVIGITKGLLSQRNRLLS